MTSGERKDSPGARAPEDSPATGSSAPKPPARGAQPAAPPGAVTGSEDGLVTSEDLFGDMLDAGPAPPPPRPASPLATPTRRGPIKVQVSEPGTARKTGGAGAPEQLPEDVAALLDAFSEPAESATREAAAAAP